MASSLGSVFVQVNARSTVEQDIKNDLARTSPSIQRAADDHGRAYADRFSKAASNSRISPTLDVRPAQAQGEALKRQISGMAAKLNLDGDPAQLNATLADVRGRVAGMAAKLNLDADPARLNATLAGARGQISGMSAKMNVDGDPARLNATLADARGRVTATSAKLNLDGDPAQLNATLAGARGQIAAMAAKVNLDGDPARLNATLADVRGRLAAFSGQIAKARLEADDGAANQSLDRFEARLLAIGTKVARPRIDLQGALAASAQLAALSAAMDRASSSSDHAGRSASSAGANFMGASRGMAAMVGAAAALGPALIPVGAVAVAAGAGVAGAFGGAAAALGVFGATAKVTLTGLSEGYKQIDTLKKQAMMAEPGSKAQEEALRKLAIAQQQYTQTFGPAAAGMMNLHQAWNNWQASTRSTTLPILAQGMNILAAALPKLRPLFDVGAEAARRFLNAIQSWVTGGGMDRAVAMLTNLARQVLPYVQTTLHNLAVVAGNLAPVMADLGVKVAAGVARMTSALAAWSSDRGKDAMSTFMAYIRENGPRVIELLTNLARAAVTIASALAPLAPVSLAVANTLAKLIAALPPWAIQAITVAIIAWSASVSLLGLRTGPTFLAIQRFAQVGKEASIAATLAAAATRAWGIAMVVFQAATGPIGLVVLAIAALVAGFVILWNKSAAFREFWIAIWHGILVAVETVWNWIRGNWPLLLGILTGPIGIAVGLIVTHWNRVRDAAKSVFDFFRSVGNVIAEPFIRAKDFIVSSFDTWWVSHGEMVKQVFRGIWSGMLAVFHAFWDPLVAAVRGGVGTIQTVVQTGLQVIQVIFRTVWGAIQPIVTVAMNVIRTAVSIGMAAIQAVFKVAWDIITAAFRVAWALIEGIVSNALNGLKLIIKVAWDVIVGLTNVFLALITGHWSKAWNDLLTMFKQIGNAIRDFASATWENIRTTALRIWTALKDGVTRILTDLWAFIYNNFGAPLKNFFTVTIPSWFDAFIGFVNNRLVTPFRNALQAVLNWIISNIFNPIRTFFTSTIPGWFDTFIGFVGSKLVEPWKSRIKGGYDWIVNNVFNPLKTFVTQTIPNAFQSGVSAIEGIWNRLQGVVSKPVGIVLRNVIQPLFNAINTVTGWVGLDTPMPTGLGQGMAQGGMVNGGTPGKDSVLGMLMPGEVVVPTHLVNAGAVDHLRGKLPGFAAGGEVPAYATGGAAGGPVLPVMKMGDGGDWRRLWGYVQKSGIPSLSLTSAYRPGDSGSAHSTGDAIDVGGPDTASTSVNTPMNRLYNWIYKNYHNSFELIHWPWGGIKKGQDVPGSFWGQSTWLAHQNHVHWAINGGPGFLGQVGGAVGGAVMAVIRTVEQLMGGLGKLASTGIALAKGDIAGAVKGFLSGIGVNAGGAQGGFAQTLLKLPGTILAKVVPFLIGKVKAWVAGQQAADAAAGAGSGATPATGTTAGMMSKAAIANVWQQGGGPAGVAQTAAAIALGESGGNPSVVQKGQPPGLTGYGLWQITPTSGIWQNGAFGNLLNALNNARAAVSLYRGAGNSFRPWVVYNTGAYLRFGEGGLVPDSLDLMHQMAGGGVIREPVFGVGQRTGQGYVLGERGPEVVTPMGAVGGSVWPARRTATLDDVVAALHENTAAVRASGPAFGQALTSNAGAAARQAYHRGGF